MRTPMQRQAGRTRVLPLLLAVVSLAAGCFAWWFARAEQWAIGMLLASFALLIGLVSIARAQRPGSAQPVRFVPHAHLMAAVIIAVVAALSAYLLSLLGRR